MAGSSPRLSGLNQAMAVLRIFSRLAPDHLPGPMCCATGEQISRLAPPTGAFRAAIQIVEVPPVHQMDPHQADEVEWPCHGLLAHISQAQQQEDGQSDEHLTAHGILGGADKL